MEKKTSSIRYSVRENRLPVPNAPAFVAQVYGYKTVTRDQLVNLMTNANTTVSRQDILVVLDLLDNAVREQLLNGHRVMTGLFNARVSIKGGFESARTDFTPDVHRVQVSMTADRDLKRFLSRNARLEKVRLKPRLPEVDSVYDFTTDTVNGSLTRGHLAELKGHNLFLNGADPALGIYLVREGSHDGVKIETVNRRTSGTVLFTVPGKIPAGQYTVTVRCCFGTSVREGELKQVVSIN